MKVTIGAAVLVAAIAAAILGQRALGSPQHSDHVVLRLTGHATLWAIFDNVPSKASSNVPRKGFGPGDDVVYRGIVTRQGSNKPLGRSMGHCLRFTTAREKPEVDVCTITVTLADGQIVVSGAARDESDNVLAVIGGTGRYRGARGEATEKFVNDNSSLFTLRFTTQ